MAPKLRINLPTDSPSPPTLIYSIQIYLKAIAKVDCSSIFGGLSQPQSTGRPLSPRAPMVLLYLLSRSPLTSVPRKMDELEEWLNKDRNGVATQCEFGRIPCNRTLRGVFRELDELENEVAIVQAQVERHLKGHRAKTTRDTHGKPKAIRSGRPRKCCKHPEGCTKKKGRNRCCVRISHILKSTKRAEVATKPKEDEGKTESGAGVITSSDGVVYELVTYSNRPKGQR